MGVISEFMDGKYQRVHTQIRQLRDVRCALLSLHVARLVILPSYIQCDNIIKGDSDNHDKMMSAGIRGLEG